jgi:hypothetical protein
MGITRLELCRTEGHYPKTDRENILLPLTLKVGGIMPAPVPPISPRRPWLFWGVMLLFLGGTVSVPLLHHRAAEKLDIPKLLSRLEARGVAFHVLTLSPNDPSNGCYLSVRPLTRREASKLVVNPSQADKWKGIVFCAAVDKDGLVLHDELIDSWGEYGLRLGGIYLFGDPVLLRGPDKTQSAEQDCTFSGSDPRRGPAGFRTNPTHRL